jgi:predicted nucleic acid-binding protein
VIHLVIDASVAAKWFLPAAGEPLAQEALELLRRYGDGEIRFLVPDLFWGECGNVMWKAVQQGRLSRSAAEAAVMALAGRGFPTTASRELLADAFNLATTFGRSVYDCLYVALALRSNAQMVTADEKLAIALAAHLPVKWLGSV